MRRVDVSDVDLHGFVDGELDASRLDLVRAHLDAHPADAARVETWRRQNAAVRRAYDTPARDPLPARPPSRPGDEAISARDLSATPQLDQIRAARRRRRAVATLAAFFGGACVALLGAIGIGRLAPPVEQVFAGEPAALSPTVHARRARLAWRTFARDIDRTMDRPQGDKAAIATALYRVTALPRIPDLSAERFELVTARTMPGENEPAAFLLYESPALVRVGLIVERSPEPDTAPALSDDGGLRCLFWRAAGYSFTLVGPAQAETLRGLGRAVSVAILGR